MSPPRPKREYEERPSDEDGTPFDRFMKLARRVIETPKAQLDEREREARQRERT